MVLTSVVAALLLAPQAKPPFAELRKNLASRTPVLVYHDFVPRRDRTALWFDCTPDEFTSQLDWLKKQGATFISVQELYYQLAYGKGLPRGAVVLTFADNYQGFYKHALPILRKRRIPAAMFVHTGFVGSQQGRPKMSWQQLRELDREGLITIASQTVSHPADLAKLPDTQVRKEMVDSKAALEKQLGHRIDFLAYPNGKWDSRSERQARLAGYFMAFTEAQKPAEFAPNMLSVPRYVHTRYRQAWRDSGG